MPTIFSHAVFAAATGKSFFRQPVSVWFWILIAVCAIIPDADVITRVFISGGRGAKYKLGSIANINFAQGKLITNQQKETNNGEDSSYGSNETSYGNNALLI